MANLNLNIAEKWSKIPLFVPILVKGIGEN